MDEDRVGHDLRVALEDDLTVCLNRFPELMPLAALGISAEELRKREDIRVSITSILVEPAELNVDIEVVFPLPTVSCEGSIEMRARINRRSGGLSVKLK